MSKQFVFKNGDEVIAAFGQPKIGQRKTLVGIRNVRGESETFKKEGGDLTADAKVDLVVVPCDGSAEYPCKRDIFASTWVETAPGAATYRRKAVSKVVQVPEGVQVTLKTLEGDQQVRYPDYIAIGGQNEVYTNRADWVAKNLQFA